VNVTTEADVSEWLLVCYGGDAAVVAAGHIASFPSSDARPSSSDGGLGLSE
jgi:hypothetical protein